MPPNQKCPACDRNVPDWHFEWHTQEDQKIIFAGQATMQCPFCNCGTAFDGFELQIGDPDLRIARRDIFKASMWAWHYAKDRSLSAYLRTEEGQPYMSLWAIEDVQAADLKTAQMRS